VKRRHVLGAASAGLAAALWPAWLREAFGDGEACDGPNRGALQRVAAVASAYAAARGAGKPLLVLVIPDDDMQKWERGRAFGELLNHGDDKQLAPLAHAEVACATMAELKRLFPNAGAGEPLMVLVSADRTPPAVRQLDVKLPDYPPFLRFDDKETWEDRERREDAISDKRIAALAGLIRGALGDGDAQAKTLAVEVRKRLSRKPPRGSRWAQSSGCGTQVEGDDDGIGVACGMGHVPKKSARFLYFFAKRSI
jgi:hypothetical protein